MIEFSIPEDPLYTSSGPSAAAAYYCSCHSVRVSIAISRCDQSNGCLCVKESPTRWMQVTRGIVFVVLQDVCERKNKELRDATQTNHKSTF